MYLCMSPICLSTAVRLCVFLGTVERVKAPGRCLDPESVEPQSSMATGVSTAELIKVVIVIHGRRNN